MASAVGWQKVEGALVFLAGMRLSATTDLSLDWWLGVVLFFAPDLSFLAYLAGPRVGALSYNAVHIYGFGVSVFAIGLVAGMPWLAVLGALWLAHSGLDRLLGYGLKLPEGFKETHLGRIGRSG
jgi:hypothetical protein